MYIYSLEEYKTTLQVGYSYNLKIFLIAPDHSDNCLCILSCASKNLNYLYLYASR